MAKREKQTWTLDSYSEEFSITKSAARHALEKLVASGKFTKHKMVKFGIEMYGGFRPEIRGRWINGYHEI